MLIGDPIHQEKITMNDVISKNWSSDLIIITVIFLMICSKS